MLVTTKTQKINLVEGKFTPREATDLVSSLINEKVNFHKLQRLGMFVGEEGCNATYQNDRIIELCNENKIAREFISQAKREGYTVKINGTLEITIE